MERWAHAKKSIPRTDVIGLSLCLDAYKEYDSYVINNFGLTDPFLARTQMPSTRPAHKYGLFPLAEDIVRVRKMYGFRQGAFRQCVEAGEAPQWIKKNLRTLETIERKAYNTRNFWENLLLAIRPIGKIKP
jgi:hypothetical protein